MKMRFLASAIVVIGLTSPVAAQQKTGTCTGPQEVCRELASVPQKYDAAYNKGDASAVAAVFTKDAVLAAPRGPNLRGTEELQAFYANAFRAGFSSDLLKVQTERVIGDMAWAVGQWSAMRPGANHTTRPRQGNWGAVFVRDGDTWKIQMLAPNVMEPAPGRTSTASSK